MHPCKCAWSVLSWEERRRKGVREGKRGKGKTETEKCRFEAGMTFDTAVESVQTCQV